jgi:hypothetical protein
VKPATAITGTVFDPNGERLAGTHVQAFRRVYSTQGARVRSVMSVITDDLGDFRLFWLRHGEYYVSAAYSDREQRAVLKGLRLAPNLSKPDDGFPTIYLGGDEMLTHAQRVILKPTDDSAGNQIFLRDGPRHSMDVTLVPEGVCARVAIVPEGGVVGPTDFNNTVCGTARLRGLSAGTYAILATNDVLSSGIVLATTTGATARVQVPMQPAVSLSGRISGDASSAQVLTVFGPRPFGGTAPTLNVRLTRNSPYISQEIEMPVGSDGTFTVPSVGPGSYDVSVYPLPENSYVRSITYGGQNALSNPLEVRPGINRLDIQLGSSSVVAQGAVVDRAGRPVPGAQVVLVPRTNRTRADRYLATTSDVVGNFRISGVPPADYVLLAFEDIEPQAYFVFAYDSSAFNKYVASAPSFNAANESNQQRVVAIPAEETAGGIR